jgi:tripartite-type tricarboxylate transporter receptor subunit TctC
MLRKSAVLSLMACALLLAPHAGAQEYPEKAIRFVVPFAPGATDAAARAIARPMMAQLGKPIVVETRPGADGGIGGQYVAKAAPDGYTLLYTTASSILRGHLIAETLVDPMAFTPVGRVMGSVNVLVVPASFPVNSVADLIAYTKANPGKVSTGGLGGGSADFAAILLQMLSGVEFLHVPYKGNTQAIGDLLAGRLNFMFVGVGHAMSNIKAGKLRALGVTDNQRFFLLPDVPSMAETGLKGFDIPPIWHGIVAPLGTGAPVVDKLSQSLRNALNDADVVKMINGQGYAPRFSTPQELGAQMRAENEFWGKLVKAAGIQKR